MELKGLIELIKRFLKQYWPGLAVAFFDYEEGRVSSETRQKEAAQLNAKNLQDEKDIRNSFAGKSDADVIHEITSKRSGPGGTDSGGS
jgi:phosphoglucomutase